MGDYPRLSMRVQNNHNGTHKAFVKDLRMEAEVSEEGAATRLALKVEEGVKEC
jgi:hypothetical protein